MKIFYLLALIALAFYSGWTVNQWRHDAHEKQTIEAAAASQRELHALEQARSRAALDAQNLARAREVVLRADAAFAGSELARLRDKSARAVQNTRASHEACIVTATAQAVVLTQCGAELATLAGDADRHASDVDTLMGAWPK